MDFSKNLLEFRAKHNLTQTQTAEILGIKVNMICRYEKETNKPTAKNKIMYENKMKEWEKK